MLEFLQQNDYVDEQGNTLMNDRSGLFYTKREMCDAYRKSHKVVRRAVYESMFRLGINFVDNRWVRGVMNQERRGCHFKRHIEHNATKGRHWSDEEREVQMQARIKMSMAYREYKAAGGQMSWHEYRSSRKRL